MDYRTQINALEEKLLDAFRKQDLLVIDQLIHDDAQFVYPNGMPVTKAMVLDNYRKGNSAFTTITPSDQHIHFIDDTAVVSLNLELVGKYHEELIRSHFRYIRVWKMCVGEWKVIAVSGVPVVK
jgi:hypothetical protein